MQKSCHVVDVIADQRYHANSFCAGNPTMKFYTESDPTEIDRVSSSHSLLLYLAHTHTHTYTKLTQVSSLATHSGKHAGPKT